ncbi:MAG: hypothetical protein CM15mP74_18270 [Halieaceae bacterium]|nr:MAG: hypothetical protein CM15mP74_18270 [Halieaceae bacterium]
MNRTPRHFADGMRLDTIDLHGRREERQAIIFALGIGVGARKQNHVVSVIPKRGPDFGTVDDVIIAIAHGAGLHRTQIRAMVRLGKPWHQISSPERMFLMYFAFSSSVPMSSSRTDPVQADGVKDNGGVVLRQLLIDDVLIGRVCALPTYSLGQCIPR